MKIALCSSTKPFVKGGYRFIVDWLDEALRAHGHEVERVYLPFDEEPSRVIEQLFAYRLVDLTDTADRVVTFRPPAHLIPHPNKVVWFIHHLRGYYDLWDTPYRSTKGDLAGAAIRARLMEADSAGLREARRVFANSQVVSRRLKTFNDVDSQVLYPPLLNPERFRNDGAGDAIVSVCRLEHHKRQHLLIEAMRHVRTPVKLKLYGAGSDPGYVASLVSAARGLGLRGRVEVHPGWVSEDAKVEALAGALAVVYAPYDEDSYGYPSLEAAAAGKPVVTTTDAGGVVELVEDGESGFVTEPDARALAEAFDQLWADKARAERMGAALNARVDALDINWPHVVEALTS